MMRLHGSLSLLLLLRGGQLPRSSNALSRIERQQHQQAQAAAYEQLKSQGVSEVEHTTEGAALRSYQLRKKKVKGLLRKREASLADVLFPGVTPDVYQPQENAFIMTELVQSKKTQVPFELYDLPITCDMPSMADFKRRHKTQRKNLGARLQGVELKPAPFVLSVQNNMPCKVVCERKLSSRQAKYVRKLVERQYRAHMTLDQLPVLMRNADMNYAVRGYPIGFKAPAGYANKEHDQYFLYNHVRFTINYSTDLSGTSESSGIVITGFDVHPVSIKHAGAATCSDSVEPQNDPATYMLLETKTGTQLPITFSYSVEWFASTLPWADRWDVYLIGSPDDDIHLFAIINSLMIVLFLTGAIATIMVRTLKNDISAYNEVVENDVEETGWKLVHGDVFRPPLQAPMVLSVLTGTGAQIGTAFLLTMLAAMAKLLNPLRKGHFLTAVLVLYVLSGCVSGYVSARVHKFCDAKNWKLNTIMTAATLPGCLVVMFSFLNVFLTFVGAATALSFWMLLVIFLLWTCVSSPLVFVGAFFGLKADKISVPTRTNKIARQIPETAWYLTPPVSFLCGGILPFGSVCIELFFIMSALWLHQLYYVMGFLFAVLLILAATCAQVSIVMVYLQLCGEDHRWWWKSFGNCASAGFYLFLYSLWFLSSRLDLVGVLPVIVYLTYMSMISVLFGIFCGSIGFLVAFWFNKTIYGALKVD